MALSLEEIQEAHGKSQRLLESLTQIPILLTDDEVWATERRNIFASLRRGLVDCITNGCLEAPIFGNRQIEDVFVFLLTLALRSERRRENVLLCFKCLRNSESWSLVLRGSRRFRELLKQLPSDFRDNVLDAADASELLLLLGAKKKKKKKSSRTTPETDGAPVPREEELKADGTGPVITDVSPERAPEPAQDPLAENSVSVSDSVIDMPASRMCPEDLLAENSLSISDSGVATRAQEDLLTEPSLTLSVTSPDPEGALPGAAVQRPPRPCYIRLPTPTGQSGPTRNSSAPSPASGPGPRRSGSGSRRKEFEELGPRCPNGKPMTRELMIKEGQKRRDDGSRTPTLRRLLSRGGSSPPSDTPCSILARMKQKLIPSRAPTPSPASRTSAKGGPCRDFGGADRFGVKP